MRVGIRLEERSCSAVVLDGPAIVFNAAAEEAATTAQAVDRVLSGLDRVFGGRISEITADVGRILHSRPLADVVAIRISPRPPADAFHVASLPEIVEAVVVDTVHVRGGHDMRARELAALGMEEFRAELPRILSSGIRNVAITALGATSTDAHEALIADAILAEDSGMRISISHDFYGNSFRDRDFTTIFNSALMDTGDRLVSRLEKACGRYFPSAVLSYVKNDGGRALLGQLAVTPVHGLQPEPACRILGAAMLAQLRDGEVIVSDDAGTTVGAIRRGVPVTASLIRNTQQSSLASNTAVVKPYTANHPASPKTSTVVVDLRESTEDPMPFGLQPTVAVKEDLALVGCAAAPWTAWIDRLENVDNKEALGRVQQLIEEDVKAIVVQSGASPTLTGIVESNPYATPYGNPGIVRLRVQAAGQSDNPPWAQQPTHRKDPGR